MIASFSLSDPFISLWVDKPEALRPFIFGVSKVRTTAAEKNAFIKRNPPPNAWGSVF